MSRYLIDQIESTEETLVKVSSEVASVTGADHLEAVTVRNSKSGETETVPAEAILVFIGAAPYSDPVTDVVELDDTGYVLTRSDLMRDGRRPKSWRLGRDPFLPETVVPGIFAAGDVRHDLVRRVASAVGQDAVAVSLAHKYFETV